MEAERLLLQGGSQDAGGSTPAAGASCLAVSPAGLCARCHQPLTRRGARGECLRCALRVGLSDDVEANGQVSARYGHFEVARGADDQPVELGRGAMATTYRATDTTLHLPVALKIISRHAASRPYARARFLREARAAARLHHPNVAGVIYHGEQDGECFYAMELVEGETLAERVRRAGAFNAGEALEIGVQVARALAAAEAHGVIHRDLKPSNLMLIGTPETGSQAKPSEPALHVKVIDWGLAKVISAGHEALEADQTRDAFVGTPAFASPEQFTPAAERRVDVRSDIYSLGVTLWYLLCGRVPFVETTLDGIHARQQALPLEQLKAAKVPSQLAEVLKSMLALDPADRPQSARELLDALRHVQTRHEDEKSWVKNRRLLTRRLVAAVALAVVLTAGAKWWRWQGGRNTPSAAGADKPSIAVLPFGNLGANEADAFLTTGVRDDINNDLAYVAALRVIGANSTRSYLPGQRDLSRIGAELGVRYLLEGSVQRQGDRIGIDVRLNDLHEPHRPWSARYTRQISEVFAVQSEIARAVTERLRVPLSDTERAVINRPPTTNLAAYDLYRRVHGRGPLFQTAEERDRYFREVVVPALESAVKLDPGFVFAYCDLAEAYAILAVYEMTHAQAEAAAKSRARIESALARARSLRPDAGRVHMTQGAYLSDFVYDNEQTRREYELARRELPNNAELEKRMGTLAREQNRWEEAATCLERSVQLEPRDENLRWNLAVLYRALRRYEEADRELGRVIDVAPTSQSTAFRLNLAVSKMEARGDLTPLQQALSVAAPTNKSSEDSVNRTRMTLAVFSHDPEAISKLLASNQTELSYHLLPAPRAWFEALAARMRHDEAAAQAAFRSARVEVEHTLQTDPTNGVTMGLLAVIDAGLGRRDEAMSEAVHACEMKSTETDAQEAALTACDLAVVYAWTDQPDRACETLELWITRPAGLTWPMQPTYGDFRLNPVWDPLRGHPRFEALIARLAPTLTR